MKLGLVVAVAVVVSSAFVADAHAGRPLSTDDACILPEGACQLETWFRPSRHLHQFVFQPACNPWGGVEWGMSLVRQNASGEPAKTPLGLQGKTMFRDVAEGSWGAGASLGVLRQIENGSTGTLRSATLIFSVAPTQPMVLHANLGATQTASLHARANWSAAIEYALNERLTVVAESYGERHARPAQHVGMRTWLRPDRLQLDATLGREQVNGRPERFMTFGLVWVWNEAWRRT